MITFKLIEEDYNTLKETVEEIEYEFIQMGIAKAITTIKENIQNSLSKVETEETKVFFIRMEDIMFEGLIGFLVTEYNRAVYYDKAKNDRYENLREIIEILKNQSRCPELHQLEEIKKQIASLNLIQC